MSITYAVNSCFVKTPPFIEIDDKNYSIVKIDSLYWTVQPLSSTKTGLNYTEPDQYGLLNYRMDSVISTIVPDLPQGWRVPSVNDLLALFGHTIDGSLINGQKSLLASGENYWFGLGTNLTGLNLQPNYVDRETAKVFAQPSNNGIDTPGLFVHPDGNIFSSSNVQSGAWYYYYPVRFCRDV